MAFIDPDDEVGFVDPDDQETPSNKGLIDKQKEEKYKAYLEQFRKTQAAPQIPRSPTDTQFPMQEAPMSRAEWEQDRSDAVGQKIKDVAVGAGETALSMATGIPATFLGGLAGITAPINPLSKEKNPAKVFEKVSEDLTYAPRTEMGQKMSQQAGTAMQVFPPYGAYVGRAVPRKGKALPPEAVPKDFANVFVDPDVAPVTQGPDVIPVTPEGQGIVGPNDAMFREQALARAQAERMKGMTNETQQMPLFDQPEQGRIANPYEAKVGDWRVDENGIPFKADLSMEVANLENPLQRNLWGDELERTRNPVGVAATLEDGIRQLVDEGQGSGKNLTDAIDSMDWAHKRGAINRTLKGEVKASGPLDAAVQQANSDYPSVFGSQRGALNPQVFDDAFKVIKALDNGVRLVLQGNREGPRIFAVSPNKELVGMLKLGPDVFAREWRPGDNLEAQWVTTDPNQIGTLPESGKTTKSQYPGLATEMYKFAAENGNDIVASKAQTPEGAAMWERFKKRGFASGGKIAAQRGALNTDMIVDGLKALRNRVMMNNGAIGEKTQVASTPKIPTTPEDIATKNDYRAKLGAIKADKLLEEWSDVATREEALELSKEAKDIKSTTVGQAVVSGLNQMAVYHNHPLLRYARKLYTDARAYQTEFSKKFVTNKKDGLATIALKLNAQEKADVLGLLQEASKRRTDLTVDHIEKAGMNTNQRAFIEQFQAAMKESLDDWNRIRQEQGLKPVPAIPGYMPGVFRGDFKSVVLDAKGKVLGVITADSPGQFSLAQEYIRKNFEGATFTKNTPAEARRMLRSNTNNKFVMKDYMDIISMLAENDPRFAEVQGAIEGIVQQSGKDLFSFDVHSLQKKGVFGNEGNKPWMNKAKNTKEAFDSMMRFIEESAEFRSLQKPITEINTLLNDPELQKTQPNTLGYMQKYMQNANGSYVHDVGQILNKVFDTGSKLLENTPGLKNVAGPTKTLQASNVIRNKMAGVYMGWFNTMFALSQLVQPVQTGMPFLMTVANRLGGQLDQATVLKNMGAGMTSFIKLYNEEVGMFKDAKVSPEMRALYEFGKRRGIFEFSELETAYEGHKTKVGRITDRVAEASMRFGEQYSRGPMFLAFGSLLLDNGIPLDKAIVISQHLTDTAMISYHPYERAMMYTGAGVMGQHAGGLTTFKHGYLGQQAILGKEVGRTGNPAPLVYSAAAIAMLAGITGLPFYEEIDELYGMTTDAISGKRHRLSEDFLGNSDQWIKTGLVSSAMGLNMQGKFSAANMVPDSIAKGVFPHLSGAWDIGAAMVDAAKNGDEQAWANLVMAVTPSGWKQAAAAGVRQDEEGNLLDKDRQVVALRTEKEWKKSAVTGLVPLNEATDRNAIASARKVEMADRDAQKTISDNFERAVRNNATEHQLQLLLKKYADRKGNPENLINHMDDIKMKQRLTERWRAQGIPETKEGAIKYQYYQ